MRLPPQDELVMGLDAHDVTPSLILDASYVLVNIERREWRQRQYNVIDELELEVNYDSVNNKWEIKKSVDLVARYWWMSSQGWTHARREAMIFDGQYSHGERSRLIE